MKAKSRGKRKTLYPSFLLLTSLMLTFFRLPLYAQEDAGGENKFDRHFIRQMGMDFQRVLSSPAHWKRQNFVHLASISGVTLFLFALDKDIRNEVLENRTAWARDSANFFSTLGDGAVLLGGLTLLYGIGEMGEKDSLRRIALLSLESLVTTTALTWTAKFFFGRSRPSTGESNTSFHPFSLSSRRTSFPSGHAASALAVATTIAEETDAVGLEIAAYSLAGLVGLARIVQDKHWASDVFLGSATGYFVAKKICHLNRSQKGTKPHVSFKLSYRPNELTIRFSF